MFIKKLLLCIKLFMILLAFLTVSILCADNCLANVPINRLKKQVDWTFPLHIETGYTPIEKERIIAIAWGMVNIDSLVQRGINKDSLTVLYYDKGSKQWIKIPQTVAEYPNEGPNVGNVVWDYGPYVGHDVIYFELQRTVPPLSVCKDYVLISADKKKRVNWIATKKHLSSDLLFRMTGDGACTNEGWFVNRTYKSDCAILPSSCKPYSPQPVSVVYNGKDFVSSSQVLSKPIPVQPGEKIEWRVIFQITKIPELTMDKLPGKEVIKKPGQTEGRLPRVIWGLIFRDKSGRRIKKAPRYWRRDGEIHSNPVEVVGRFTVPANAATYQYAFYVGGKGEIKFNVLDILVYRQINPIAKVGNYSIHDAGKIFFPQIEIRKSSNEKFQADKGIKVRLSPKLSKLTDEEKRILLDGLRAYKPTVGTGLAKVYISLLDEDLKLPAEIEKNQKLKEQVNNLPSEGYVLSISSASVHIWGRDSRGVFYALQELGERLQIGKGKTDAAIIIDWPELPLRMIHLQLTWRPLKRPKEYCARWIPQLARHRINAIAFDDRRDWYRLNNGRIRKQWERIFKFCRKWNVEPVAMGYNFRNSMPVRQAIWLTPGKWVENEPYILKGLKPVPLQPKCDAFHFRPLRKSSHLMPDKNGNYPVIPMIYVDNPVIAKSADGKTRYEIGKDFVIEGKVDWSGDRLPFISLTLKKPFTIRRTKNSRIPDGGKVLLSYNYLYRVRGWHNETYSTCISSRYARDITCTAIRNTIKKLHPYLIHINQDEVVGIGRDGRDKLRMRKDNLTAGQLFADLLNCLKDAARSAGYTKPLIVWDDGLTLKHPGWILNYNGPYFIEDAINYISPKDFIINVWWYGNFNSTTDNPPNHFLKLGFPIIGSSSEGLSGIIAWTHYLATKKLEYPEQIRGMFMTIWKTPETNWFRSKRDFGRLAWNPSPWVQFIGGKIYVYDPYYKPVTAKVNGKVVTLKPAQKLPADGWLGWQSGYVYYVNVPKIRANALKVEVMDQAGYKSSNIVIANDDLAGL